MPYQKQIGGKRLKRPIEEAFWEKVDKRGDDECWPWLGARAGCGYGHIRHDGTCYQAHRVSLAISRGSEPQGQVDHICRNRSCVNPNHLRPCTPSQNMAHAGKMSNNTSGFRGVSYNAKRRAWRAYISFNHTRRELGYYKTVEEAVAARTGAEASVHGEFA